MQAKKCVAPGLPSPEYMADELAQAQRALAQMGAEEMPAADLTELAMRRMLSAAVAGAAIARARSGALSRFLDWCQDCGQIKANPCVMIGRARRPKATSTVSLSFPLWFCTIVVRIRWPAWSQSGRISPASLSPCHADAEK